MTTATLDRELADAAAAAELEAALAPARAVVEPFLATTAELFEKFRRKRGTYKAFTDAQRPHLQDTIDLLRVVLVDRFPEPLDRAKAIASVIVPAEQDAEAARYRRDMAALVLVEELGWKPVKVYRLIGVSRSLLVRFRSRCPAVLPTIKNPERQARKAADEVTRIEAIIAVWQELRDEVIFELFDTHPELSNADIGRIFRVKGQRITIMRTQLR